MKYITNISVVSIIFFIVLSTFSGCVDPSDGVEDNHLNYDLFVKYSYTAKTKGWNNTHFNSISEAIEKANNYSKIYVYNGTYKENIIIQKPIDLIGENANATIIDAGQIDDVILINENGSVNISGFTLRNSSIGSYPHDQAGIDVRTSNNRIFHNIIEKNNCGIHARHAKNNNISHNLFINNLQYGIYFYTTSDWGNITHNVFRNNTVGCRVKTSTFCTIRNNLFYENSDKGLYVCCGSNFNIIFNNAFINNTVNANDQYNNIWNSSDTGNYWYDFITNDQFDKIDDNKDGIFDISYDIPSVNKVDFYPLVRLPEIKNVFLNISYIQSKYL